MNHQFNLLILICLTLTFFGCDSLHPAEFVRGQQQETHFRSREDFGNDWQFQRLQDSLPSPREWDKVFLPHSVKIEPLIVNEQWQGKALYRKTFYVDKTSAEKWFFQFEGVMQEAEVKINDSMVKLHQGGYLPFTVDATPFLKNGQENTIEVNVTNVDDPNIPPGKPLEDLDFNYYGGIYRNVYLVKTGPTYITDAVHAELVNGGGLLLHFEEVNSARAGGFLKTHVQNDAAAAREIRVRATLRSQKGEKNSWLSPATKIAAGEDYSFRQQIELEHPKLWSPSNPQLYELKVELLEDGQVIDQREIKTGIRSIRLTADAFYLNGKKIYLNGTNRHQEYPYLGYALSDEANYRDAYQIKQAGFNFVRLSHYPQTPAFYEACDELGILLMDCMPGWQFFGGEAFQQNALQDIRDMARRDRNHPSVVFWENSLNESGMTAEFIVKANEVLKEELPYHDTYSAGWIDHPAYDLFTPARQHSKPPDYWNKYNKPNRPILIAEYGDWEYYAQNAGFNQTAFTDLQEEERSSRQLRAAGEKRLLQQALNFQEATNSNLKGAQTIGMANWLMYDYNRGYSDDLEASGIADIFRIPKFSFYFYKSQKGPFEDKFSAPMVYVASYWQPDSSKDITVFSNTEEVALYLNGRLIEKKKPERDRFSNELAHPPFHFQLPQFEAGTLKAEGYINGKAVATHVLRTPEAASKIEVSVDLRGKPISEEHPDVIFVYARILDSNGTLVHSSNANVNFKLSTADGVEVIGENPVEAEAGVATILLRSQKFEGPVTITATSEGLDSGQLTLE
ncbi:MAG: glycoside hydrolase family 2 TIM barrel-domain containing protein [Salinimicrobium sp.]